MGDHPDGDGVTADLIRDFTRRRGLIRLKACLDCGRAEGACMCSVPRALETRLRSKPDDEALS